MTTLFSAFQDDAFQIDSFQMDPRVTSTRILERPVDYVLAGDQIHPSEIGREYEIAPRNLRTRGHTMRSGVRQLSGGKPSFTVTTSKRGYD
mgnify:CR=1 FL=1